MFLAFLASSVFFSLALGSPTSATTLSSHIVHESRPSPPSGWKRLYRAPPTLLLPVRIALRQSPLVTTHLDAFLMDVSDPISPNYGKHWKREEVREMFKPESGAEEVVGTWLEENGLKEAEISKDGGWIKVQGLTVAHAERLFRTEYWIYAKSEMEKVEYIACLEYSLPEHVSKIVDFVMPTLHFDVKARKTVSRAMTRPPGNPESNLAKAVGMVEELFSNDLDHCDTQITPACLQALYNFHYTPVATKKNSIGIVEYTPQSYMPADMDMFFANFSPSQVGQRPQLIGIDGGALQSITGADFNSESDLDLQYAMALVGKSQPVTLFQVGDIFQGGSFNTFLDALDASYCTYEGGDDPSQDPTYPDPISGYKGHDCGTVNATYIISTSYAHNEADLTPAYMQRQCNEYAKLGLMGITIIYSSGDSGVAGSDNACIEVSGTDGGFSPSFPGTCPYVTAVGATQINNGSKVTDPESACERHIYSGGGFSNVFPIPSYQQAAVGSYLANYPPQFSPSVYNSSGTSRAIPDLSANGANYVVAVDGTFQLVYGTSASSPVIAAILSAINDARLAAGKSSIGFINPTIYSPKFQNAFNDITNGTNPGCGTPGFSAGKGWDPVTGVGTPNFQKLMEYWLELS